MDRHDSYFDGLGPVPPRYVPPRRLTNQQKLGLWKALKALRNDPSQPGWRRFVNGAIIVLGSYVLSPIDFAPEAVLGPLGLLDDAGAATMLGTVLLAAARHYQGVWLQRRVQR